MCERTNVEEKNSAKLCSALLFRRKLGENMPEEIVHRFEDKWAICWGLMGGWEQRKCMSGRILKHIEKCGVVTNCTLRGKVCELLPCISVSL